MFNKGTRYLLYFIEYCKVPVILFHTHCHALGKSHLSLNAVLKSVFVVIDFWLFACYIFSDMFIYSI